MVTENSDGTWSATIQDREFQFGKWGAEKAILSFAELTKMASYGIGDAASMLNDANRDQMVGTFITLLVKGIGDGMGTDPKKTLKVIKQFCCDSVFCDGQAIAPETFDIFFRKDIFFAFEVARANMEVQYSSFFKRLAPAFGLIREKLANLSKPSAPQT